jgi:hypothetical protein
MRWRTRTTTLFKESVVARLLKNQMTIFLVLRMVKRRKPGAMRFLAQSMIVRRPNRP